MRWRRVGDGGAVAGDRIAHVCRTGRRKASIEGSTYYMCCAPCEVLNLHHSALGSYPHFYTSEHSERFSHLPKVTY